MSFLNPLSAHRFYFCVSRQTLGLLGFPCPSPQHSSPGLPAVPASCSSQRLLEGSFLFSEPGFCRVGR